MRAKCTGNEILLVSCLVGARSIRSLGVLYRDASIQIAVRASGRVIGAAAIGSDWRPAESSGACCAAGTSRPRASRRSRTSVDLINALGRPLRSNLIILVERPASR